MKKWSLFAVAIGSAIILLIAGYQMVQVAEGKSKKETVERDEAESLSVELDMGVGSLNVEPGSNEWLVGQFDYRHSRQKPVVSYKQTGSEGHIDISEQRRWFDFNVLGFFRKGKSEWNVKLNDETPTALNVDTGVSDSHLNLRGLYLTDLDVDTGVGDVTLDLSGERQESFDVKIDSGVGDTKIALPEEIGVKLKVDKGVGALHIEDFITQGGNTYVNEAYENGAAITIEMDVDMGVGDITVVAN
ncbi:toast rack family protein [Thalassobacillus sp. CUG 92003]|uniref:toast rack family protein n=1 Tax=Thalassobacillus sp. CUG 92003 TaxID=2736641 RepID=UPI0015E65252|nr:toast rack family protein [Thalassobacillus sp. CUG 92003]